MSNDFFEYDPEEAVIRLKHKASATLLSGMLTAGKFGDYLDSKLLLNKILANLLWQLSSASDAGSEIKSHSEARFAESLMYEIGQQIANQGEHIGWWKMSKDQQTQFIRDVVASPHTFHDDSIEQIFESIESSVHRANRLAQAAARSS
tara:strand:+ start:76 stop:519 length:444 start_codon:yes stop_codon:yes gene_type:complete